MSQENKICVKCLVAKPVEWFYVHSNGRRRLNCIECHKQSAAIFAARRKQNARENHRSEALKRNYDMTVKQYNDKLLSQDGKCSICERHQTEINRALAVDHNHDTGQIRDLLCECCNSALGKFREDKEILERAIRYLERHNVEPNTNDQKKGQDVA